MKSSRCSQFPTYRRDSQGAIGKIRQAANESSPRAGGRKTSQCTRVVIIRDESGMENELKNLVLTLGALISVSTTSLFCSTCQADGEHNLPDAPVPVLAETSCRKAHAVLACTEGPQQGSAQPRTVAGSSAVPPRDDSKHAFWDRENLALFSFVGASRALDYSSTLNMRRRGRQEILLTNDI